MKRVVTRGMRRYLERENKKQPVDLTPVPREFWPDAVCNIASAPFAVWRSKTFLAQAFQENGAIRLSVNRTALDASGGWGAQISWDELMELKRQAGYGDHLAVEIFPRDRDIVNVSNMRHLWLVDSLPFGWTRG